MSAILSTNNIAYSYGGEPIRFPDFSIERGAHWLILGHSGCGKTTLLHLLAGMLQPLSGSIRISGTEINRLGGAKLDRFRGRNIGIILQQPHLVPSMSVLKNLTLAQYMAGLRVDRKLAKELLGRLNLEHKAKSLPGQLSQGERQRVGIARAVINNPAIILADEPTSSLDDMNCDEVAKLLLETSTEHQSTLIIVTHDQRLKDRFANQVTL